MSESWGVCCFTAESPDRMAAALEPLRRLVDEIVLVVDQAARPDDDDGYAPLGDIVVRAPFPGIVERPLAWMLRQCTTDWILRIDGDEIVSAALIDELSSLQTDDITHALIARRWLHADPAHMLDVWPWHPDHLVRAVRNDPPLWQLPGRLHDDLIVAGPFRLLEHPIYHADLLIKDVDTRRAKCRSYTALNPDKLVDGKPINDAFYLPEERDDLILAEVAAEDLDAINALLEPPRAIWHPGARLPHIELDVMDRYWSARPFDPSDYGADLALTHPFDAMPAGATRILDVRVHNRGGATWSWGERLPAPIHVSYRWEHGDGSIAIADGLRSPLPVTIGPGASEIVPVSVLAPTAGSYMLALELVHETVRWFGEPLRIRVEVA